MQGEEEAILNLCLAKNKRKWYKWGTGEPSLQPQRPACDQQTRSKQTMGKKIHFQAGCRNKDARWKDGMLSLCLFSGL